MLDFNIYGNYVQSIIPHRLHKESSVIANQTQKNYFKENFKYIWWIKLVVLFGIIVLVGFYIAMHNKKKLIIPQFFVFLLLSSLVFVYIALNHYEKSAINSLLIIHQEIENRFQFFKESAIKIMPSISEVFYKSGDGKIQAVKLIDGDLKIFVNANSFNDAASFFEYFEEKKSFLSHKFSSDEEIFKSIQFINI